MGGALTTDRPKKLGLLVEAAGLFREAALGFGQDSDSSPCICLPAMVECRLFFLSKVKNMETQKRAERDLDIQL